MKRTYWVFAACLSLLLLGGLAYDVSAQQSTPQSAAPSAPQTESTRPGVATPPATTTPDPAAPSGQMRRDTPPVGSTDRDSTVVDQNGRRIFGMQPTVALIIGAVLLVIIVLGLVAMSRRDDGEVRREHQHRV